MSIQAVAWVLDHSESRGLDRLVLICLANHTNPEGVCWPSQRTLAREARISKTAVINAVRRLAELAELEVLSAGTARQSARYRLPFAVLERGGLSETSELADPPGGGLSETSAVTPGVTAAVTPGVTRTISNHQEPLGASLFSDDPPAEKQNVQALVGGYVDDYRATHHGRDPSTQKRTAAARAAKRALADGEPPEVVAKCLGVCAEENKNPASCLDGVIGDYWSQKGPA